MFAAPRTGRFEFEIKDDVVLFGEFEDFFERGDALAGELAAEPRTGIEAAQLGQSEIVDSAFAVRSAIAGVVMDGDEARVARELEVGLDERSSERDGATKCGQSIFRRVARRSSMCNDQHGCGLCSQDEVCRSVGRGSL